jgi:hypothetical protein
VIVGRADVDCRRLRRFRSGTREVVMKPLDGARLKIAQIHEQLIATPKRWATYGDVAKAIGWDDSWGPQRVAKLTQQMFGRTATQRCSLRPKMAATTDRARAGREL